MVRRRGVIMLLVVIISLLAAWPAVAARRVAVDVILLVDTSDSMADELQALCRGIAEVEDELDRRGITVHAVVLGIAETRACADEHITRLIPEGRTRNQEDWGLAVADLARHYEWTPGAARLIIPLSDEGPLQGDPVEDDDEQAVQAAIRAAQANEVMVSPVLGTEFNSQVEPLARELAQETDGRVFISKEPGDDLTDGLRDLVMGAADRARADITLLEAIPTPRDIVRDGGVVSTNLVMAILLTLVLGVASAVLEGTLGDRRSTFGASRLGRVAATAVNMGRAAERLLSPGEWSRLSARPRRLLAVIQLALFLVLMAFLAVFLQPGLNPVSWRGLGLWLGVLLALGLVSLIYEGTQYWLARQAGATPTLRLRPGAPLVTFAGVVLSRIVGFVPGYFYGRVTCCTFRSKVTDVGESPPALSATPAPQAEHVALPTEVSGRGGASESHEVELALPRRARIVLIGLGAVGAAGLSLWVLTVPTSLLLDWFEGLDLPTTLDNILSGLVGTAQGFFSLGFFLAWQTLFFELLPLRSTGGGLIYQRNRLIWAVITFGVFFVLLHTLVNPFGTAGELLESQGLVLLLLWSFLYSALAVGMWFYFALRGGGQVITVPQDADAELVGGKPARAWGRGRRTTVMAISLIVIWALGACSGLVMLVMRLLS